MLNIADRYAQVKMQIEALEDELKGIKAKAEATGLEIIDGDQFRLTIKEQSRSTLDRKVLEQWLSAEQLEEATKVTTYPRFTYKPIFKAVA